MKLLISEHPLQVLPSLAKAVGLNKAIVLQQLHYWLQNEKAGVWKDGKKWVHNTYEEWNANFPFWSIDTVRRTINALEDDGLIVSEQFAPSWQDRTKSYRIDYEKFEQLEQTMYASCTPPVEAIGANCTDVSETTITENTNTVTNVPEVSPMPDEYSIEWKIAAGKKVDVLPDQKDAEYRDSANLIAMTFGANSDHAFAIAYTFMKTRNILITQDKIKGQRKAVKEMIAMKVNAAHVEQAVKQLIAAKMTVVDLYSISKTAIALANPVVDKKPKKYVTVYEDDDGNNSS